MRPLSGVALDSEVAAGRQRFRDATLFTHRGLSGPAVLQASSYWTDGPITLDLLPGRDAAAFLLGRKRDRPRAELRTVLAELLPQRLAEALAATVAVVGRMADISDRVLRALADRLRAWTSRRAAPRATRKPRSRAAASTRATCRSGRWRRRASPACS